MSIKGHSLSPLLCVSGDKGVRISGWVMQVNGGESVRSASSLASREAGCQNMMWAGCVKLEQERHRAWPFAVL